MRLPMARAQRVIILAPSFCAMGLLSGPAATAKEALSVKPVVQRKIEQLPARPPYWRVENFRTPAQALAAAGPASLAAEVVTTRRSVFWLSWPVRT